MNNLFFAQLLLNNINNYKNEDLEALYKNNIEFATEFNRLLNIACTIYDIENLPEELEKNKRIIFLGLLTNGQVTFFKDDFGDLCCLPSHADGLYDKYGNLLSLKAVDYNGVEKSLNDNDSVTMYSDVSRTNSRPLALYKTATRLADIIRTCDVRTTHHKMPLLFKSSEQNILSDKTKFYKVKNNTSVIFERKDNINDDSEGISSEVQDINFLNIEFIDYYHEIENMYFASLGVNYAKANKKERMIESEVNANNEQILANRETFLSCLRTACKEINEKWGYNLKAVYKFDTINDTEVEFNEDASHDKTKGIVGGGKNDVIQ